MIPRDERISDDMTEWIARRAGADGRAARPFGGGEGAGARDGPLVSKPLPVKPTARQLAAGARAGNVSVECAWRIYQAMTAGEAD